jgi:hypothetical protein
MLSSGKRATRKDADFAVKQELNAIFKLVCPPGSEYKSATA